MLILSFVRRLSPFCRLFCRIFCYRTTTSKSPIRIVLLFGHVVRTSRPREIVPIWADSRRCMLDRVSSVTCEQVKKRVSETRTWGGIDRMRQDPRYSDRYYNSLPVIPISFFSTTSKDEIICAMIIRFDFYFEKSECLAELSWHSVSWRARKRETFICAKIENKRSVRRVRERRWRTVTNDINPEED